MSEFRPSGGAVPQREAPAPGSGVFCLSGGFVSPRGGFTLLELLVTMTIMAVLGGAVYACFAGGLRIWDRSQRYGRAEQSALFVMARIGRDVANAVRVEGTPFRGGRHEVSFATQVDAYAGPAPGPLDVVAYRFEAGDGGRLLRRSQRWPPGAAAVAEESYGRDVAGVELAYASAVQGGAPAGWGDVWQSETNLPSAVRVTLSHREGETLTRVFPAGASAPAAVPEESDQ